MAMQGYPTINDIGLDWLLAKLCETEKWDEFDRARSEWHKTAQLNPPRRMIWQHEENERINAIVASARRDDDAPSRWERDDEQEEVEQEECCEDE